MATEEKVPLEEVLVTERPLWQDGPPHELFKRMRSECPVHWTPRITEYPEEDGFWSVPLGDAPPGGSRDGQPSRAGGGGVPPRTTAVMPPELTQPIFMGMDPPKHDRLKALFQRGFTP